MRHCCVSCMILLSPIAVAVHHCRYRCPALCLDVQVSIDSQRVTFESQLRDKVRELNDVQAKFDAHSAEMRARYQPPALLVTSPSTAPTSFYSH